jgi:diguanylate cyclase (GGDEF)-like protein
VLLAGGFEFGSANTYTGQTRIGSGAELVTHDPGALGTGSGADADATIVASSAGESVSGEVDLPEDWMATLGRGQTMLGEPYWDESLGAVGATIAVPIESPDARFLGVLLATLTFDAVGEILEGFAPGAGGRIDLIAGDGGIIVASGLVAELQPSLPEETLTRLATAVGGTLEYVDGAGVEMVGTMTQVERREWRVLTHLPTAEAYAQIAQLRNSTFVLVSFLMVVVGTIAYFIGLFIVRPLGRLAEGAAAVAGGDLSVDLPVTGRDEVGYLTGVFNGMVSQLRTGREQLDEANEVLREQNVELERISMTDALTTLFNRRYLMNEFEKELNRAGRHERHLALVMMDVDRFKQYNDSYGHLEGDEVLRGMGRVVFDATREGDVPARYGGEEFIVLLPDCDLQGAIDAAERIRSRLAEEVFEGGKVTVSIGVAEFPTHGSSATDLIAAADAALYEAKDSGRDRVMAAGKGPSAGSASPEGPKSTPSKTKAARRKKS